jgi:hypothetical protein
MTNEEPKKDIPKMSTVDEVRKAVLDLYKCVAYTWAKEHGGFDNHKDIMDEVLGRIEGMIEDSIAKDKIAVDVGARVVIGGSGMPELDGFTGTFEGYTGGWGVFNVLDWDAKVRLDVDDSEPAVVPAKWIKKAGQNVDDVVSGEGI